MPELQQMTGTATDLRKDDVTTYGKVINVDAKVKWATITFQGQAGPYELRRLKDEQIAFSREVPTDEEKLAEITRRTLLLLDVKEAQARSSLRAARERMIKGLEAGERADYWHWMDVPQYQAVVDLWDAVAHVHRVHAQGDEPLTRVEAFRRVRDNRHDSALSYYSALSRSTSVVSNLFDDLKIEALSTWERELEWLIGA
jgi:hypothetical protein